MVKIAAHQRPAIADDQNKVGELTESKEARPIGVTLLKGVIELFIRDEGGCLRGRH